MGSKKWDEENKNWEGRGARESRRVALCFPGRSPGALGKEGKIHMGRSTLIKLVALSAVLKAFGGSRRNLRRF